MTVGDLNGIYVGYFSAKAGDGVVLFVFLNGILSGADAGAFKYDGTILEGAGDRFRIQVKVTVPPNSPSIVGFTSGPDGLSYNVDFSLPYEFSKLPFIEIQTPYGPINMRLVKLRDLPK